MWGHFTKLEVKEGKNQKPSIIIANDRVLNKFRSSLLPSKVEALVCTQYWILASVLPPDKDDEENDEAFQDITSDNDTT